jgi:hypothetical protein
LDKYKKIKVYSPTGDPEPDDYDKVKAPVMEEVVEP